MQFVKDCNCGLGYFYDFPANIALWALDISLYRNDIRYREVYSPNSILYIDV